MTNGDMSLLFTTGISNVHISRKRKIIPNKGCNKKV